MNATELLIWSRLRGRHADGWKFRRQHPIGEFVVDFYCPAARLVIEVDGPTHDEAMWAYDVRRQAWLESVGYRVHRIPVGEITRDLNDVMDGIYYVLLEQESAGCARRPHPRPSGGTSPPSGEELLK